MYKLQIEEVEKKDEVNFEFPEVPFVIQLADIEINYLISNHFADGDYIVVDLKSGKAFTEYTKQQIQQYLTDGEWKLVKSTIIIEK